MSEQRPADTDECPVGAVLESLSQSSNRANRMILMGAPAWVRGMIHLLHVARITEVKDWSRLTPTRNPDEVISLMHRPRLEE